MEMNNTNIKQFLNDFKKTVKVLEQKYGVVIDTSSVSYSMNDFHTKLTVSNGTAETVEKMNFEKYAFIGEDYGITKDDYGKKFTATDGGVYTLVGFSPRARKNPCIIRSEKGTQYTCSFSYLGLTRKPQKWTVTQTDTHGNPIKTTTVEM